MLNFMLNFRVTEEESALLSAYAEEVGQSMTDVVRSFIRSLEGKLRRIDPSTIRPELLPSVPLARLQTLPPVAAVYFLLTEDGEALYVGQTQNLALRHCERHHHDAILKLDAHARIHWLERRASREPFERACIRRFKPKFNTKPGSKGA